jgi:DNA primase
MHSLVSFIKESLDVSVGEAYKILDEYDDNSLFKRKIERTEALASSIILPGSLDNPVAKRYLEKRNFDPAYLEQKYGIRYTNMVGDYKFRIIIPIYKDKRIVSFTGRDYTGKQEPRYKNLSIEKSVHNPKHLLYNQDNVKYNAQTIGVCEGPFDVMRLGDGFVATLGIKVTEEQIRLLAKYKNVYVLFDPEKQAQERAKNLAERVAIFGAKVYIIDTELGHDPGDMTEKEVQEIRNFIGLSGV